MTEHPRAFAVVIGDELVTGGCPDENGPRILHELEGLGFDATGRILLPDAPDQIARQLRILLDPPGGVVIVSGGLGPAHEDKTREAIAEALGTELELDAAALARIEKRYAERGRDVPAHARSQALRPATAELLPNPSGRSPGFVLEHEGCMLAVLPGDPRQLREMLEKDVVPRLRQRLNLEDASIERRRLRIIGLAPEVVRETVSTRIGDDPALRFSVLPLGGEHDVLLTARVEQDEVPGERMQRLMSGLTTSFGDHLVHVSDPSARHRDPDAPDEGGESAGERTDDGLMGAVRDELLARGWTVGTAESCTGGMVAARITGVPGSSRFFRGSIVAYADDEKTTHLGVPAGMLESFGAVSSEVARAMAEGCRTALRCQAAIAVTGIAGPAGGTETKPVGLVYLGVATPAEVRVTRHLFRGARQSIRIETTAAAVEELRRLLLGLPPLGQPVEGDTH